MIIQGSQCVLPYTNMFTIQKGKMTGVYGDGAYWGFLDRSIKPYGVGDVNPRSFNGYEIILMYYDTYAFIVSFKDAQKQLVGKNLKITLPGCGTFSSVLNVGGNVGGISISSISLSNQSIKTWLQQQASINAQVGVTIVIQ
ncbi:Hypothetical_protein [Hexamita inflata]|uniref:Hypothetical_protein n=1 Tax=Hexamita inflata TaxID=28002 RepID=A0AA86NJT1_9EUKA|nr:Hypothetical protein HINF_LOCUS7958 [Hexamita inflata]